MAEVIDILYSFYEMWVGLFRNIPYGDPWLAVFSLGLLLLIVGHILKEIFDTP